MRSALGAVVSALGGALIAYSVVGIVDVASDPFGASADSITSAANLTIGLSVAGFIAIFVAAFVFRFSWTMVVAPVVGLLVAGVLLVLSDSSVITDNLGFSAFIALSVLAGPLIVGIIFLASRRRQAHAQELARTGNRAIAVVQGAQPTGVLINHQPQMVIHFLIRPVDGTQPFPYQQRRTVGFGEIGPKPGLAWPAWYRPGDTSKVAIAAPSAAGVTPELQQLISHFGLTPTQVFGYDPTGGGFSHPTPAPT